jgi:uncharacterized repeat protein (TIGR03943 family)
MTSLFTRWIPSLSLGAWSAILLASHLTGRAAKFLHPAFRPGVLAAGLLLALLALLIASRETPPECCADATCTHPLSRSRLGRWLTFGILVLPASFAVWLSPDTFSRQAFEQRGITMDATGLGDRRPVAAASQPAAEVKKAMQDSPGKPSKETVSAEKSAGDDVTGAKAPALAPALSPAASPPIPAAAAEGAAKDAATDAMPDYLQRTKEGYIITEVLDLLYSVQDSQLRKDFEGRTVQLIAQIMPDKTSANSANRFKAVRMFMSCCAADARPVATLVESKTLPEFPEMTWVKVVGTATFPIENGKRTAVIQATLVEETKPPEEAMLF